jgi:hypothetical protein
MSLFFRGPSVLLKQWTAFYQTSELYLPIMKSTYVSVPLC